MFEWQKKKAKTAKVFGIQLSQRASPEHARETAPMRLTMTQNLFATYHIDELPTFDQWLITASTSLKGVSLEKIARAAQRGGLAWETLSCAQMSSTGSQSSVSCAHSARTELAQVYEVSKSASSEQLRALNEVLLQDLANGVSEIRFRTQDAGPIPDTTWTQVLDGVYTDLIRITAPAAQAHALRRFLERHQELTGVRQTPHPFQMAADVFTSPSQSVSPHDGARNAESSPQSEPIRPNTTQGPLLDTTLVADRGGSDVFELAALLAWASESVQAGLEEALPSGVLMSLRSHTLGSICKIRAARQLWAVFTAQRFGQQKPLSLCTETARHEISCTDTWTNLLRLTAQTAAALIGGSDRHAVLPHDSRRATPNPFGNRLARNIMHILQKECHLDAFDDPVAGAWAFETHTHKLAESAWNLFLHIEQQGGWCRFLSSGEANGLLRSSRAELIRAERHRQPGVLGVSTFANAQEAADLMHHEYPQALLPDPPLKDPPSEEPDTILYLSDVFASLQAQVRKDWPYRDQANKPVYDLIQIGDLKELSARLSWTETALAAAGLAPGRTLSAPSVATLEEMVQGGDAKGSQGHVPPSALAVLVTTDDTLASELDTIETTLSRLESIRHLIVAGRIPSGRTRPPSVPVRIDAVLNMKSDLYGVLEDAWKACGKVPLET